MQHSLAQHARNGLRIYWEFLLATLQRLWMRFLLVVEGHPMCLCVCVCVYVCVYMCVCVCVTLCAYDIVVGVYMTLCRCMPVPCACLCA